MAWFSMVFLCVVYIVGHRSVDCAEPSGLLANARLLLDTRIQQTSDVEEKLNDGYLTLPPTAAGNLLKIEMYVDKGGGKALSAYIG